MARRNRTPSSALTEAGELDVAVCESARVNRDRRILGKTHCLAWVGEECIIPLYCDVCYWHLADMIGLAADVGSWG